MVGRTLARYCELSVTDVADHSDIRLTRFLYTLFIAVDGNFKLKGKERHLTDIELMPGWGAYVPESEYKSHLAGYVGQPEVSTDTALLTFLNSLDIFTDQYLRVTA
jgi:hypothetical protein